MSLYDMTGPSFIFLTGLPNCYGVFIRERAKVLADQFREPTDSLRAFQDTLS